MYPRQAKERELRLGPSPFTRSIGARLGQILAEQGITQTELAARTGVPRPVISRIIAGKANPTVARVEYLFDHLGYRLELWPVVVSGGGGSRRRPQPSASTSAAS